MGDRKYPTDVRMPKSTEVCMLKLAVLVALFTGSSAFAQATDPARADNLAGMRATLADLHDLNPEKRIAAVEAIKRHARAPGAAALALPVLAEAAQKDPVASVRAAVVEAMLAFGSLVQPYAHVVGAHYVQPGAYRQDLNFSLIDLAPQMGGMLPALIECVSDTVTVDARGRERYPCADIWLIDVLIAMGPTAAPVVPAIVERLRSGSHFDDQFAVALGTVGEAALPQILDLVNAEDVRLRYEGAVALGRTRSPNAVAPLMRLLGKPSDAVGESDDLIRVRAVAAQSLGRLAGLARGARQQLAAWVNRDYDRWGPDSIVSTYAQQAMGAIDANDPALMTDLW